MIGYPPIEDAEKWVAYNNGLFDKKRTMIEDWFKNEELRKRFSDDFNSYGTHLNEEFDREFWTKEGVLNPVVIVPEPVDNRSEFEKEVIEIIL